MGHDRQEKTKAWNAVFSASRPIGIRFDRPTDFVGLNLLIFCKGGDLDGAANIIISDVQMCLLDAPPRGQYYRSPFIFSKA
jgi:hypothetical protein